MSALAETLHTLASHVLAAVPADVPNPGQGELPPGAADKILMLLRWGAGIAVAACVGGFIWAGTKMAIVYNRGDNSELGRLGRVAAACVIVGSASTLVAAFV